MSGRQRNKTASSVSGGIGTDVDRDMTPIDFIDLTVDSAGISPLRCTKRRRRPATAPPYDPPETHSVSSDTRYRTRRHHAEQRVQDSSILAEERNESVEENCKDLPEANETHRAAIINLSDSAAKIAPCINDSCSGQSRVLTCPVCYEELSNKMRPTSTRCGHVFCTECIQKAVKTIKKCPLCKKNITLRNCIRLHL